MCGHAFNELRTRPELKGRGRKGWRERHGRGKDERYTLGYLFLFLAEVNLLCQLSLLPSEQYVPWRKCPFLSGWAGMYASQKTSWLGNEYIIMFVKLRHHFRLSRRITTVCWKMKTYAWRQECRDTFYCSTVIGTRVSLSWVCRDAFKMRLNRREEGAFCEGEHYNAAAQTASIPLQLTCVCILSHCTGLEQRFCIIS